MVVVLLLEDGAPSHEHVRTGASHLTCDSRFDASVDLEIDIESRLVDHLPQSFELRVGGRDKALTSKAGIDAHDENEIQIRQNISETLRGGVWVEGHTRAFAESSNLLERAM